MSDSHTLVHLADVGLQLDDPSDDLRGRTAISRIDEKVVHISPERTHVAGGPAYDPDVVPERYCEDIYGYPPFWGPFPR